MEGLILFILQTGTAAQSLYLMINVSKISEEHSNSHGALASALIKTWETAWTTVSSNQNSEVFTRPTSNAILRHNITEK